MNPVLSAGSLAAAPLQFAEFNMLTNCSVNGLKVKNILLQPGYTMTQTVVR